MKSISDLEKKVKRLINEMTGDITSTHLESSFSLLEIYLDNINRLERNLDKACRSNSLENLKKVKEEILELHSKIERFKKWHFTQNNKNFKGVINEITNRKNSLELEIRTKKHTEKSRNNKNYFDTRNKGLAKLEDLLGDLAFCKENNAFLQKIKSYDHSILEVSQLKSTILAEIKEREEVKEQKEKEQIRKKKKKRREKKKSRNKERDKKEAQERKKVKNQKKQEKKERKKQEKREREKQEIELEKLVLKAKLEKEKKLALLSLKEEKELEKLRIQRDIEELKILREREAREHETNTINNMTSIIKKSDSNG